MALLALAALLLSGPTPRAQAQTKPRLLISAAASLKDALIEINTRYVGAKVYVNYGASGTLQRQIEQGAPVDVFVSAATKNMNELVKSRLVDGTSRRNVAANRLVLVVPSAERSNIRSFADLAKPGVRRVALGNPDSVPAGSYARQALTKLGIYGTVARKAVLGKDVREVLTQVELGNVEAGIVYKTDALISRQVRIVATAPTNLHLPIVYPAGVISDSRQKVAASNYLRFLATPTARNIFKKYGFLAP